MAQVATLPSRTRLVEGAEGFFDGGCWGRGCGRSTGRCGRCRGGGGPFDGAHDVAAGSAGVAVVAVEVADGQTEIW